MSLSPKAVAYLKAPPRRINLLHGSVRSGKTTNGLLLAPLRFLEQAPRGGDIIVTGRTVETAYRNIIRPLIGMYGQGRVTYNRGSHEGRFGSRTFFVFGANDEKAADKVQGMTVAYWLGDEVSNYPESFVRMGLSRLSLDGALTDWTMNPQGPYHYIKRDFIDRASDLDLAPWHFTLEDNPNLPPSYIENLKLEYGEGTLWFKRFIEGLWVAAEGAVYDFFNEDKHTLESPPGEAVEKIVAIDYGTSNATAAGLFGINPNSPVRAWLEKEWYYSGRDTGRQKTDSEYADEITAWLEGERVTRYYLDPSAASFKAELRRRGLEVTDANNDVLDGIRTQARMLKSGEYKILRSCKQTIRDYGAYLWDTRAQERGEDKPLKTNDHTKDMERYALHTHLVKRTLTDLDDARAMLRL
jgi:PBSX family phage terminase large subunit